MEKYILAAISTPQAGQADAFNRGYDEEHLPDVCAIPGVVSARRFQVSPASPFPGPAEYLALYEVETDDPQALIGELIRRSQAGEVRSVPGLDRESARLWLFKQL